MKSTIAALSGGLISVIAVGNVQAEDSWWFAGQNWRQWKKWISDWKSIAYNLINGVRTDWKRLALRQAMKMSVNGAAAEAIKSYLESKGMNCPDKPWWLALGRYAVAWPMITCAYQAR